MANTGRRTNFDKVLQVVREDPESVFNKHARMLSDLTEERIARLKDVLSGLTAEKRAAFYRKMDETNMESFEFDFAPIARIGMDDENGDVRAAAVRVLGFDDSRESGRKVLDAAANDPSETAQVAAINVLGQYMADLMVDNPIPVSRKRLYEVLLELIESRNENVRRAAVISFATSETDRVKQLITGYLAGNDPAELITGLRAVRISIGEDWDESVLELMRHEDEEICIEAIQAAGAIQLREALPLLYELISRFDRISPELLLAAANAVSEIGDEGSADVLEMLGEAAVDMDEEITEGIDDCIDMLNMTIYMDPMFSDDEDEKKKVRKNNAVLDEAIEAAKDRCLSILEEKIPHDLEDDEPYDFDDEDDECGCGEEHHHHHHHHHHHDDHPLEGLDLSRFRILDDLEAYESAADRDADEEDLWAEFEDMAEEDLDADSLQDFINKLEKKQSEKNSGSKNKSAKKSGRK